MATIFWLHPAAANQLMEASRIDCCAISGRREGEGTGKGVKARWFFASTLSTLPIPPHLSGQIRARNCDDQLAKVFLLSPVMLLSVCRLVLLGVLLLIAANHPTVCSSPKCPSKCRCSADGKHADCQGIGLGRTPAAEEFDPRLEWLDLRRNGLSRAEFSRLAGLPRLHTLALGLNPIRHLEKASIPSVCL